MSTLPACSHPRDIAKEHSLFEIDETLDLLVQAATDQYDETGQIAAQEIARLEARRRAAENREKRLKEMLAAFMKLKDVTKLRGRLNTISFQKNSRPTLVVTDPAAIPAAYYRASVVMSCPEWQEVLDCLPPGALRRRLEDPRNTNVDKDLNRGILFDALRRGEEVEGAHLVTGNHVRTR